MSTWNTTFENTPVSGDAVSVTPSQFTTFKGAVRERLIKEHVMNLASGLSSDDGWHVNGSAKLYYGTSDPTTRPDGTTSLTSADYGRMYFNSTTKYLKVYDGGSWTTPIPPDGTSTATVNMLVKRDSTAGAAFGGTLTAETITATTITTGPLTTGAITASGDLHAGFGAWTIGTEIIPSFRFGFGLNFYSDGTDWLTNSDGVHSAGVGILVDGTTNGTLSFYSIPNAGNVTQTILDANLSNYRVLSIDTSGNATLKGFMDSSHAIVTLTSGSGNWPVPAGVTKIKVTAVGGGGGGAGARGYAGTANSAGGGGGGACTAIALQEVTPSSSLAYIIGAGGAAGSSGTSYNGQKGGTTTFNGMTAGGGFGAGDQLTGAHWVSPGGAGGYEATNAAIILTGSPGVDAYFGSSLVLNNEAAPGGSGGSSYIGGGGKGGDAATGTAPAAALANSGGGGGGHQWSGANDYDGAAGGSGIVIIEY